MLYGKDQSDDQLNISFRAKVILMKRKRNHRWLRTKFTVVVGGFYIALLVADNSKTN